MKKLLLSFMLLFLLFTLQASPYFYSTLSSSEQALYERMEEAVYEQAPALTGVLDSIEANFHVFSALLQDHPELFWVDSGLNYQETLQGERVIANEIQFSYTHLKTFSKDLKKLEAKTDDIVKELGSFKTDEEKCAVIYSYLIHSSKYDKRYMDQSLWSVFMEGKGVCAGFAKAFQYLANKMGITAITITGNLEEETIGHAWNMIKLGSNWYHVDVTSGYGARTGSQFNYDYLLLSDETIKRDHSIDNAFPLPRATSKEYEYTRLNNMYLSSYNETKVKAITEAALKEGKLEWEIELGSEKEYKKALKELVNNKRMFAILKALCVDSEALNYTENPLRYIIHFNISSYKTIDVIQIKSYSLSSVYSAVKRNIKDTFFTLGFSSKSEFTKAKEKLFDEQEAFELLKKLDVEAKSLSFNTDEENYRITIYLK